jgi:hypothetical protein
VVVAGWTDVSSVVVVEVEVVGSLLAQPAKANMVANIIA